MASVSRQPEQENLAVNASMGLVFFQNKSLAFNYKTGQWSRLSAALGKRFFSVDDNEKVLGTIEASGLNVMVQDSSITVSSSQDATMVTGETQIIQEHRALIDGVRPLTDGASLNSIKVGVKQLVNDTVSWATGTALHSRTGMSNFRGGENVPEGRYHRIELKFTGGFNTLSGVDVEFYESGEV